MATNLQTSPESGLGELVSGIVQDAQELIGQQLALFKQEMRQDLKKAREGAVLLGIGAGTLLVGSIILSLMLVQLIQWLEPTWPSWISYGIVGGGLAGVGAVLALQGRNKLGTIAPEQSAKALEENLEWKTKPS